jgi:hypothetical protein
MQSGERAISRSEITTYAPQISSSTAQLSSLSLFNGRELLLSLLPCVPGFDWSAEIKRVWAEGSANTLAMAAVISSARKQLKRKWAHFWRTSTALPFQKKKADMLVGVARLIGLSEHTLTHLPRGWSVLYHLGRLEPAGPRRQDPPGAVSFRGQSPGAAARKAQ